MMDIMMDMKKERKHMNKEELKKELENFLLWYYKEEIQLEGLIEEQARKNVQGIIKVYLKEKK